MYVASASISQRTKRRLCSLFRPAALRKALNLPNPVALGCLGVERDGQLIVLQDGKLMGFPLEDLAKIMTLDPRQPRPGIVPGKVATHDAAITLMKVGTVAGKRIGS